MEHKKTIWRGSSPPSVVRFGDFELDLRAAELRKGDQRIRLQEQPFQILVELLEHPGQLVLREEIRRKLWPNNTIVEFDHSINAAVKRLRDALQDSAESPRYVETLARRGYRFIASVSPQPENAHQPGIGLFNPAAPWVVQDSPPQNASIAVLPFTNMSGDPENEYFSDGLAEELINELAHVPGLKVIARTSAFAFKGKQEDIRNIAGILGVAHIVEGSVRRAGSRIRIGAQLIAAVDGTHVWSERYDREMADIFALQDEIAQAIATALRLHLTGTSRQYRPSLPAYEAYLTARNCLAAFTRESLPKSKELFEQVITMDPGFALAQSGLAMSLVTLVLPGIMAARLVMPGARAAATRALEIDPGLQEAHAVLGMVAALYEYDWDEAGRRFRLATVREPVAPYIRWYFSFSYLLPMSRARESVQECMRGLQDDPLNFMGGFGVVQHVSYRQPISGARRTIPSLPRSREPVNTPCRQRRGHPCAFPVQPCSRPADTRADTGLSEARPSVASKTLRRQHCLPRAAQPHSGKQVVCCCQDARSTGRTDGVCDRISGTVKTL